MLIFLKSSLYDFLHNDDYMYCHYITGRFNKMGTRTIADIDNEIAMTKEALKSVKGTETEVYARIVGYYRSVRNWNKGKRDEYDHRKQFVLGEVRPVQTILPSLATTSEKTESSVATKIFEATVNYEFFGRKTCPNCLPVKKYLAELNISGIHIDVDTDEGFTRATEMTVLSAPTVILFTTDKKEIGRAHNISELSKLFTLQNECVA